MIAISEGVYMMMTYNIKDIVEDVVVEWIQI